MSDFGNILRDKRCSSKLSQRRLAEISNVDISYISKLESSQLPPPSAETIVRFAKILGCDAEYLLASAKKIPKEIVGSLAMEPAAQRFLKEAYNLRLSHEKWEQMTEELRLIQSQPVRKGRNSDNIKDSKDRSKNISKKADDEFFTKELVEKYRDENRKIVGSRTYKEIFSESEWLKLVHKLSLSSRQADIIKLLFSGCSDKQIARNMQISVPTVRTYLSRLFLKYNVQDRNELILYVFYHFLKKPR